MRHLTLAWLMGLAGLLAGPGLAATANCPPLPPGSAAEVDHCPHVYRLVCEGPGGRRTLTAFQASAGGRTGLVTALHGAVGCERLRASNRAGGPAGLSLTAFDLALDLALLTGDTLRGEGLAGVASWTDPQLRVVGYPTGTTGQHAHDLTLGAIPLRPLHDIMEPGSQPAIEMRGSPSLDARFIGLYGPLSPGYSGAPVLTPGGAVFGVAIGGNLGGVAQVGFAAPLAAVNWVDVAGAPPGKAEALGRLVQLAQSGLFSDAADPGPVAAALPRLLLTDARDRDGRILKLEHGRLETFFRWGQGTVYNLAWHPRMGLLFSNANDRQLNLLTLGATASIYTHGTYLRDVAVDPVRHDIFFSEASGAGRDGTIFRLRDRRAEPYRVVRLADVEGFWAGDFAFDPDGFLWLSSGNRAPANLYKVDGGRTVRVFSSPRPIKGFAFIDRDTVVYTDWKQRLYRLSLRDLSVTEVGRFGVVEWLGDVTVFEK